MDIIFEPVVIPEYFDTIIFDWPIKYPDNESIVLHGNIPESHIGLFISSLLVFNDSKEFDNDFLQSIIIDGETALCGGIQVKKEKVIGPSCCCDIQSIKQWEESFTKKESLWLGHDPTPELEYKNGNVILWSDSKESKERFSIQFTHEEAINGLRSVFENLKEFIKRLGEWSSLYTELSKNDVEDCFTIYLTKPLRK